MIVPASPAEDAPTLPPAPSPETLHLLANRRSPKPFMLAAPAPEGQVLEDLLRLSARTPDHGKLAPWRFIVFEGEARDRAGRALARVAEANGEHSDESLRAIERSLAQAPLVIAVVSRAAPHPKIPEWEQVLSAGAVCQNLILAATAMGFGAVWLTGWPTYDAAARAALGLLPEERLAGLIHIGVVTATQTERARPSVEALTTRF